VPEAETAEPEVVAEAAAEAVPADAGEGQA
jgi:hypothetical protein